MYFFPLLDLLVLFQFTKFNKEAEVIDDDEEVYHDYDSSIETENTVIPVTSTIESKKEMANHRSCEKMFGWMHKNNIGISRLFFFYFLTIQRSSTIYKNSTSYYSFIIYHTFHFIMGPLTFLKLLFWLLLNLYFSIAK